MSTDDQDKKITLVAFLGGIWPRNPFMTEIARWTPTTLREFMDQAYGFFNVEDTLETLTATRQSEIKQEDLNAAGQKGGHDCEGGKKWMTKAKRKGEASNTLQFGDRRREGAEPAKEPGPGNNKSSVLLMVTMQVVNFKTRRILVDNGS